MALTKSASAVPERSGSGYDIDKVLHYPHYLVTWFYLHVIVELYRRIRDWMPSLTAGSITSARWRRRNNMRLPTSCIEQNQRDLDEVLDAVQCVQTKPLPPDPVKIYKDKKWKVPIADGCRSSWSWDCDDRSHEVTLIGEQCQTAHFHPNWSNGTAGIRGSRPLDRSCRHYWEIHVSQRIFGTSMMFGVATKHARLHVDAFVNLLGEDIHSWGLSHKGLLWHAGQWRQYCPAFAENEATIIGVLYDGPQGTLTFYKDGESLGVAFTDLDSTEDLYPAVSSTAAKTEMTLGETLRSFQGLQDRCRASIISRIPQPQQLDGLPLPPSIRLFLRDAMP